jgi:hypothetical protein
MKRFTFYVLRFAFLRLISALVVYRQGYHDRIAERKTQNIKRGTRNEFLGCRATRLENLFYFGGQVCERRGLVDREVRQYFSVERDIRKFQPVHELAVTQAIGTSRRSDPDDPQGAKVALPQLSTRKGEVQRSFDLLFRVAIELALGQAIAASQFQNPFSLVQPFVSTFSARHKSSILRVSAFAQMPATQVKQSCCSVKPFAVVLWSDSRRYY